MVALLDFATRLGNATRMMQMQVFIKRLGAWRVWGRKLIQSEPCSTCFSVARSLRGAALLHQMDDMKCLDWMLLKAMPTHETYPVPVS